MSLKYYYKHPRKLMRVIVTRFQFLFSDKLYCKIIYYLEMGKHLDLNAPQSYNEKLQWLKLYDRNPKYTTMVDKYAVKNYVAEKIGSEYIIPTLGIWDKPEDIEWEKLPNQFVLKTTHGGGNTGVVVCKDKSHFDKEKAIVKLNKSLKEDLYRVLREWPYKNVPHRIMAEEYIEGENGDLPDYKFFCFNGVVKALFVGTERQTGNVKFDYYDVDFNHLDLVQSHPMSEKELSKPKNFELMKTIASKLSLGIPHVRVDLYNVNGVIYFGELTFYHHGGITPFHPEKWDYTFGSWLTLPTNK